MKAELFSVRRFTLADRRHRSSYRFSLGQRTRKPIRLRRTL